MEQWDQIVMAAMMGTDKSPLNIAVLPRELTADVGLIIENNSISKEEKFLQLAALLMNFRQSGVSSVPDPGIIFNEAPAETNMYCSNIAMRALKEIVEDELDTLLLFWLKCCMEQQQLIHPYYIPVMLQHAVSNKKTQPQVTVCCGKRGEWLSQFNPAWKFSTNQTVDEAWQTGSPEQRKQVLREQRAANPEQAIAMLQTVWPQEDTNTKHGFLQLLDVNISELDLPFLELQMTEKSKKVKSEAVRLMQLIPGSSIIRKYEGILKKLISLQTERTMPGLGSKFKLHFATASSIQRETTELVLETKSEQPGYSNEEWTCFQLIKAVHPSFWEQYLEQSGEKVIALFQADEMGKKMVPALVQAAVANKDKRWGELLFSNSEIVYTEVLSLIPQQIREEYMVRNFDKAPDQMMQQAFRSEEVWSLPLARLVLDQFATNPYGYQKQLLLEHIFLVPEEVTELFSTIQPLEDHKANTWRNTMQYLGRLLQLRKEIDQAFNA